MHGVSGKKISTVLRLQATRTVLPYLDIYTVQRPTINVRQLLCIRPSNQHSFDPRNNVSIALFFSYKVGGLFSVRRPFPSSSETRRGKHASSAHRVRVPCTLDMINHIININTTTTSTMHNLMLATGVSLAYHLCLRSSEYVTRTIVPIDDTHQFRTTEVEFMLNDGSFTFLASNKLHCPYSAIKLVKFSMLHAKNIRRDYGVPIWFSATDKNNQPIPFVQLLYR